jgi:hypothetical protein
MAENTHVRREYTPDLDSFAGAVAGWAAKSVEERRGVDRVEVKVFIEPAKDPKLYMLRVAFVSQTRGTKGRPREIIEHRQVFRNGDSKIGYDELAGMYAQELRVKLSSELGVRADSCERGLTVYSR